MAKSSSQKLKILYIMKMLLELTDESNTLSVNDFIKKLSMYGISAERKSIYDDLEMLCVFGLPVGCKKGKSYGYYIEKRDFTLAEVKLLANLVASNKYLSGQLSNELIQKLGTLTSYSASKQLKRSIFVEKRTKIRQPIFYNIDVIHEAVAQKKQIAFRYYDYTVYKEKIYKNNGEKSLASPYGITYRDETYFLICYFDQYDTIVHFRIDRMEDVEIMEQSQTIKENNFDLQQHVKKTFDYYGGVQTERVKILFNESLLTPVLEYFGEECTLEPQDSGTFIVRANIVITPTFLGWLFQFGNMAQILAPNSLINQIKNKAKNLLQHYES